MQPGEAQPPSHPDHATPIVVTTVLQDPAAVAIEQHRQETRSRLTALGIAALLHGLIILLLAWIVLAVINDDPPELIIESAGASDQPPTLEKKEFAKKVTNDKPSPPSRSTQIIVANIASPISAPLVEEITDSPVIGDATNGLGFGGGGFGDGRGGSSFFGTSGGGNNIVIVIDTSTSMVGNCGRDGCDAIIREVDKTVSRLPAGTRFNIICFGNDADALGKTSLRVSSESQQRAKTFMADYFKNTAWTRTRTSKFGKSGRDNKGIAYHPIMADDISSLRGTSGGSRMDLALVAAFEQKPATIFLIADGEPGTARNGRKLGQDALIELLYDEAQRAYGSGATMPTVNAISVKDQGENMLRAIARKFKGKYKSIDPARA